MADRTAFSPFRMQTYRLAWLSVFLMLAVVVLMWILGHDANTILAEVGLGLFFAASMFSVLARRFTPFAAALGALVLLGGSICA
jgi:hypothetical protein